MDYDNSAYRMYHRLNVEWPCLSFDVIHDNLGAIRRRVILRVSLHNSTRTRCIWSLALRQKAVRTTRS